MKSSKLRIAVLVTAVALIAVAAWVPPTAEAQSPPEAQSTASGAYFLGGDGQERSLSVGDVVTQTQRLANGTCGSHDFTVGGRGDVKSISVEFDQSRCAMVVSEIVSDSITQVRESFFESKSGVNSRSTQSSNEAKWRVRAEGEWRGFANEELTQAIATVEFKTSSLTGGGPLFDRYIAPPDCWGNYNPPAFNWTEDSCTSLGSASGPGLVSSTISGKFHHAVFRWMHHEIRSTAKARGRASIPAAFEWDCQTIGHVSWPATFHCEKSWKLLSWP